MSEDPAADRTHNEPERKQERRVQLLDDRITAGKKRRREVERKRGVHVEVVPLDEITYRADEDGFQPAPHIRKMQTVIF